VNRNGDVELLGDGQASVDRRGGRSPILVQLQSAGAGLDHLDQGARVRGIAFSEKAEIDRQPLGRLQDTGEMPGPGVQVVAVVPAAGPVPPPSIVVTPL